MAQTPIPLAVIGGGMMAQAIIRGGIDAGVLDPRRIGVVEPDGARRDVFRSWGIRAVKTPAELTAWLTQADPEPGAGQIVLAVKPQSLPEVSSQFRFLLNGPRRILISILAGAPSVKIRAALGDHAIVRVMSNTPARVRRGTTAVALGQGAVEGNEELAIEMFTALGRVVRIDESLMDAFTAVAGSGPAYVYYLAEAMVKAAMEVGFDRDTAQWIVRWTIAGAGALMDAADQPPETLRAAVTSKGGTTAAAAAVLDSARVGEAFIKAIKAARDRGVELGEAQAG
jgi:pyrroline-5-carboxylate reductase